MKAVKEMKALKEMEVVKMKALRQTVKDTGGVSRHSQVGRRTLAVSATLLVRHICLPSIANIPSGIHAASSYPDTDFETGF